MAVSERHLRDLIPEIKEMIDSTTAGLNANIPPEPTKGGAGGSYYMHDAQRKPVAVFKPLDEERSAVNNPEQQQSEGSFVESTPEGLKKGTKAGKGGYREVAAYWLDHPKSGRRSDSGETFGFAGVPPTAFVTCYLREGGEGPITAKLGSLQKYIDKTASCILIGPDVYDKFPKDQVHKIAVLDIRFANADRHGGNILRSNSLLAVLTPIDHGYCFPASFGGCRFDWLAWKRTKEPFSGETIDYIKRLNAEEDIRLLESYGWSMPPPVARVFRVSTSLLKKGAERGLSPYDIGAIMCRKIPNMPEKDISVIEEIVKIVEQESGDIDEEEFLDAVSREMDRRLDDLDESDESDDSDESDRD